MLHFLKEKKKGPNVFFLITMEVATDRLFPQLNDMYKKYYGKDYEKAMKLIKTWSRSEAKQRFLKKYLHADLKRFDFEGRVIKKAKEIELKDMVYYKQDNHYRYALETYAFKHNKEWQQAL